MHTHNFIHLHLKEKKCYPLCEEEQMQKNERPLQHCFHNRILLFWSDLFLKKKKMLRTWNTHTQKYLLIKGCLSFHESHVMDEIYELESASKDLQHAKLVMTSSRLQA